MNAEQIFREYGEYNTACQVLKKRGGMTKKMRRIRCVLLLLAILIFPRIDFANRSDEIHLARMLYALGRDETDETLLMLGNALMNRTERVSDISDRNEGISWMNRFVFGMLYDERCVDAAHVLMMGTRALPPSVVRFERTGEENAENEAPYAVSGSYAFYETDG